jgi:hypothetical protein
LRDSILLCCLPLQLLLSEFEPGKEHPPSFHPLGQVWFPQPQPFTQLHANDIVCVLYNRRDQTSKPHWTSTYYPARVRGWQYVPSGYTSFIYIYPDGSLQCENVPERAWLPEEAAPFPTCIQVGARPHVDATGARRR